MVLSRNALLSAVALSFSGAWALRKEPLLLHARQKNNGTVPAYQSLLFPTTTTTLVLPSPSKDSLLTYGPPTITSPAPAPSDEQSTRPPAPPDEEDVGHAPITASSANLVGTFPPAPSNSPPGIPHTSSTVSQDRPGPPSVSPPPPFLTSPRPIPAKQNSPNATLPVTKTDSTSLPFGSSSGSSTLTSTPSRTRPDGAHPTTGPLSPRPDNGTAYTSSPPADASGCVTFGLGETSMSFMTVWTSTITFTGRPEDFHPTWSSDAGDEAMPTPCLPPPPPPPPPPMFSMPAPDDAPDDCVVDPDSGEDVCPTPTRGGDGNRRASKTLESHFSPAPTSVFVVTAKTPAVVYRQTPPPDYDINPSPPADGPPSPSPSPSSPRRPGPPPATKKVPAPASTLAPAPAPVPTQIPVTNDPAGGVTIGSSTFSDVARDETRVVEVDGETFTIAPTAVVAPGGATVARPVPSVAGHAPVTTSTRIGDLDVRVTSSLVTVAGSTFTVGSEQSTVVLGNSRTVEIGPAGVTVARDGPPASTDAPGESNPGGPVTVAFPPVYASPSRMIVAGGELLAAVGSSVVVVHATTVTYGPGLPPRTEVLGTDTVVVGPAAVTVHGITIGGAGADARATRYEIVGGITLTQANPSEAVVAGTTLTVGPEAGGTTTSLVVGTETVVAAPDGITVASMTLRYPLGPTVVSTIVPRRADDGVTAAQTTTSSAGPSGTITTTTTTTGRRKSTVAPRPGRPSDRGEGGNGGGDVQEAVAAARGAGLGVAAAWACIALAICTVCF